MQSLPSNFVNINDSLSDGNFLRSICSVRVICGEMIERNVYNKKFGNSSK